MIEKEIRKPKTTDKKSVKSYQVLPDFDAMNGEELGRWILEHPDQVSLKSNKTDG